MEKGYDHKEAIACMAFNNAVYNDYRGIWAEAPDHNNFKVVLDGNESYGYTLSIRGTDLSKVKDLILDIEVFKKMHFPIKMETGLLKPRISHGLTQMFEELTPNLAKRLETLAERSDLTITGHSEGGAAAPLFALWIEATFPKKFNIKSYAFAPPSIGNKDFDTLVQQYIPYGVYRVINPCDTIPYFFIDIKALISSNTPKRIPILLKLVFYSIYFLLKFRGIVYAHTGVTVVLRRLKIDDGGFSLIPFKRYNTLVIAHHKGTYYSTLLEY